MNKVAIVNRTNLKNFGSVLQVYALCEAVKKLDMNRKWYGRVATCRETLI